MLKCNVYDYTPIFSESKVSEMICLNCGKELDNDIRVCPYCGNLIEAIDDSEYYEPIAPQYVEAGYEEGYTEDEAYAEDQDYEQEFVDDDPVYGSAKKSRGFGKKFSMPSVSLPKVSVPRASGLPVHTVLSLGAGGVTKAIGNGCVRRMANPKYPQEYIRDIARVIQDKADFFTP